MSEWGTKMEATGNNTKRIRIESMEQTIQGGGNKADMKITASRTK